MKKLLAYVVLYGVGVGLPVGLFVAVYVISGWQTLLLVTGMLVGMALLGVVCAWAKVTLDQDIREIP